MLLDLRCGLGAVRAFHVFVKFSHQIQKRPVMTRSHSGSSGLNKQGKGSLGVLMEGMRVVLNRTGWSIQARQKTVSIRQSSQPKSSSIKFK